MKLVQKTRLSKLAIGLIVALGIISYANSFGNQFVWDDRYLVAENSFIRNWRNLGKIFSTSQHYFAPGRANFYRPLTSLSFMLDYHLFCLNPFGYHLTNLIFHLFNTILVFWLINLISQDETVAFIGSLIFTVFPLHTQAVTYISGRADLLVAFLMLSAFYLYLQNRYFITLALFILALLSKETSLIFPLILMLYDFSFPPDNLIKRQKIKYYLFFFAAVFLYSFLRIKFFNFTGRPLIWCKADLYIRFLIFCKAFILNLGLISWPVNLYMERSFPDPDSIFQLEILFSFVLLVGILFTLILMYKSRRKIFFWGMWFFIFLLPYSHIVPINAYLAEHWLYLPFVGFLAIICAGCVKLYRQSSFIFKRIIFLFFIFLLIFYSSIVINRNRDWKDEITLYQDTIEHAPLRPRPHFNLGWLYDQNGQLDLAMKEYQKAIQLCPGYAYPHNNLGIVYLKKGKTDLALEEFKQAVAFEPNLFQSHCNLGLIYIDRGLSQKAREHFQKALQINPESEQAKEGLRKLELLGY